jgi:hypothetical protein
VQVEVNVILARRLSEMQDGEGSVLDPIVAIRQTVIL